MRLPKIMYHGTNMLRWRVIEKDRVLRADAPKTFEAEELLTLGLSGYVYLTSNDMEAGMYGLNKTYQDMTYNTDYAEKMTLEPILKDIIVIGVRTSNIRGNIDIDTETYNPINQQRNVKLWCKHKGNIEFKYIFPYVYARFDILSRDSNLMNQIMENNKEKLQASQSLMSSIAKN